MLHNLGTMKHWIWTIFLYLVDFITAEQGTSDQIALVLREEWLSRNLADGELKPFHEEDVVSDYDIKILLEEKRALLRQTSDVFESSPVVKVPVRFWLDQADRNS